jgi:uncharacterized protein YcfL
MFLESRKKSTQMQHAVFWFNKTGATVRHATAPVKILH